MIIEVLIFFSFVILFVLVGAGIALSARRRRRNIGQSPEEARNVSEVGFLRRNWFLVVLLILAINPLTLYWMRSAAHRKNYKEQVRNAGKPGGGDTANDTSYHVAASPSH